MSILLNGFEQTTFTHKDKTCPVFKKGFGPGVVIIHELPGITPEVARFANVVAESGFSVVMPCLFGTPGKPLSLLYLAEQFFRACISREFHWLANGVPSPITDYLRALCRKTQDDLNGAGVGVIGMCLTGNFALTLFADKSVIAPVLSQPSLPLGITQNLKASLQMSEADLNCVKNRVAQGEQVMGLRFSADMACPAARFRSLKEALGEGFIDIQINSGPNNPHIIPRTAHSVLTYDLVNEAGHPTYEALQRVLSFLHEKLDRP